MFDVKEINNNNKVDVFNYKGYFVENGRDEEKKFFEFGAHFSYKELYMCLMKLKLIKEKSEKIVKLKPKKKLNIEKINEKDKKIEENINNIIKEFKLKTRSRNIAQQETKNYLNKNIIQNELTYIPLNLEENKTQINQKNNPNPVLINLDKKLKQLKNKYIPTRNHEQKYSFELPFFFTENNIKNNIKNNLGHKDGIHVKKNFENFGDNNSIYKINNNMNLYKSYQNQIKKRNEIKINKEQKFNFIKSDFFNDKINLNNKNNKNNNKRIFSSNLDYYLNKYHFKKLRFSPLKKFQPKNIPVSGGINASNKINSMLKNDDFNSNNLNQKYIIKKIFNNRNINFNKINSFSADKKEKIMNRNIINKSNYLENNISNISGNSQNKNKNITFQNMLQDLNHSRIHHIKNTKSHIIKEEHLMNNNNYNEQIRKSKIQNLFKLLNKHEKISRNKNMNYFLNNTSYINYTHQNQNDKNNLNMTNTKSIFLDLNNILLNKERNKVRLSKNLLNNTKNITMNNINNNNNKFFNTSYINNNNLIKINKPPKINKIQNSQINPDINNLKGIKSLRKKSKKNNVNINININNNNKIIYNKVYEYKSPLLNNTHSKIIKHPISLKGPNHINKTLNSKIIKNIRNNNNNNKNIKFINIQLPKKKILNRYNINTDTNNNNINNNINNNLFS